MLHATLELARRVDRAEIDFCAVAGGAARAGGIDSIEVAGGRALCANESSPLNKMLGLGLGVAVEDADLDRIEEFYDGHGMPAQIELCPLAAPGLAARLTERGYRLQGFENQLARVVGEEPLPERGTVRVVITSGDLERIWLRVVAEGFAVPEGGSMATPPAADTVERIEQMMQAFMHPDLERLLAFVDGEPAGAACAYVLDGIVGVTGTTTLARFRSRGVQHALVARAVNRAGGRAELAMATTEPGSRSQRTFERLGFQVVYTRAVFVLT